MLHIAAFMPLEIAKQLLCKFKLENANLLTNPNVNPKTELLIKRNVYSCINPLVLITFIILWIDPLTCKLTKKLFGK